MNTPTTKEFDQTSMAQLRKTLTREVVKAKVDQFLKANAIGLETLKFETVISGLRNGLKAHPHSLAMLSPQAIVNAATVLGPTLCTVPSLAANIDERLSEVCDAYDKFAEAAVVAAQAYIKCKMSQRLINEYQVAKEVSQPTDDIKQFLDAVGEYFKSLSAYAHCIDNFFGAYLTASSSFVNANKAFTSMAFNQNIFQYHKCTTLQSLIYEACPLPDDTFLKYPELRQFTFTGDGVTYPPVLAIDMLAVMTVSPTEETGITDTQMCVLLLTLGAEAVGANFCRLLKEDHPELNARVYSLLNPQYTWLGSAVPDKGETE